VPVDDQRDQERPMIPITLPTAAPITLQADRFRRISKATMAIPSAP
jgi:hypothetical protein